MPEQKKHDLYDFMKQLSNEMAAEYDRIQKRGTEDPRDCWGSRGGKLG